MIYIICQMPDCEYTCDDSSLINYHHIIPKSMGGSDKIGNIIALCPNCHARVYVPDMKHGTHAIKNSNSVILIGKYLSTGGYVLMYQDVFCSEVKYHLLE